MNEKFGEFDKAMTKEVMAEFRGKIVESICPVCNGNTLPSVGNRVLWEYTHHLNRKSTTQIIKEGTLIRISKRKKRYLADWNLSYAIVHFDGNKNPSKVKIDEIVKKDKCTNCDGTGSISIQY